MNPTRPLDRKPLVLLALLLGIGAPSIFPCTLAIVAGKATVDGRALMWKNRDAAEIDNKLMAFSGTKYGFLGLINAEDAKGDHVWGGINAAGFAIMNSLSSDLGAKGKGGEGNGLLMKMALGECATVADFEALLERVRGTLDLAANFGVLDAEGNACFFETSRSAFQKFDANDLRVAPFGALVRTNFAFTAAESPFGAGEIRFERISHLVGAGRAENRLDLRFLLREAARDLVNEKLHDNPFATDLPLDPAFPLYVNTNDTISRSSSVSALVFRAAPSRARADLATMWALLGQSLTTVAVPLWAGAEKVPEATAGPKKAPLNELSQALAAYLYPDQRGRMKSYMSVNRLRTYGGEGVLAKICRIEDQVLSRTAAKLAEWEVRKPGAGDVAEFQEKTAAWVYEALRAAFPDIRPR